MKFAAALLAATVSADIATKLRYIEHLSKFNKQYLSMAEFEARLEHFAKADAIVEEHNAQNSTYFLRHNILSDLTEEERAQYRGKLPSENVEFRNTTSLNTDSLPSSVDWRGTAVNSIQDQAQCGSCWAFSATCALEGAHYIATGKLEKFAEQQLVDCDSQCYGCGGGWAYAGFVYWESTPAILKSDYAYTARDGTCKVGQVAATETVVTGYTWVTPKSSSAAKAAIAQQPVSVAIEADQYVFQLYGGGVFDNTSCGTYLDHAVALVGYGSENGQDYFILRNSWGTSWGDEGYMKIADVGDSAGICGVLSEPVWPTSN